MPIDFYSIKRMVFRDYITQDSVTVHMLIPPSLKHNTNKTQLVLLIFLNYV
jgi:hypothetical protein